MNREEFLTKAVSELRGVFTKKGLELPQNIVVSCGWPSQSIGKVIGECWSNDQSDGGVFEIFISPRLSVISGAEGVLATLTHELLHVSVGTEYGHKVPFKKAMKKIGLEGKPSASHAGDDLIADLDIIAGVLGEYPHKTLNLKPKLQKTGVKTLTKMCCPKDECDYIIMVKTRLIEEKGVPKCPVHDVLFVVDE